MVSLEFGGAYPPKYEPLYIAIWVYNTDWNKIK
jgi:hypothetical protein